MKAGLFLLFMTISSLTMGQGITQITSKETYDLLEKDKKVIVLDVRTPEEFKEGHVKDAVNIDIKQPDAFAKIDKLNHDAIYVVHCRTSNRSKIAADYMITKGFKNLYLMSDGFNGWKINELPLIK